MFLKVDFNIESIYDIDVIELKKRGIKGLFFDLDSTLMKSKSGKFSFKTQQYLEDLKTNFKLAIISNNSKINYIEKAKAQIDIPIYSKAKKPSPKVLLKVCREFNLEPFEVAFVGDRPLTDILAGLNAKMVTILVDSISKDEETPIVRFVRKLERITIKK